MQFADPSERAHAIWLVERICPAELGSEDFFVSECTPKYPVQDGQTCEGFEFSRDYLL